MKVKNMNKLIKLFFLRIKKLVIVFLIIFINTSCLNKCTYISENDTNKLETTSGKNDTSTDTYRDSSNDSSSDIDIVKKKLIPDDVNILIQENINNDNFMIVDVRYPISYEIAHLESAININFESDLFEEQIILLDSNKTYLFYCWTGIVSNRAMIKVKEFGFENVFIIDFGFIAWKEDGYPFVTELSN